MGGFIAIATAAALERSGASVAFLGIIDTYWATSARGGAHEKMTVLDYIREISIIFDLPVYANLSETERGHLQQASVGMAPEERAYYAAKWGQQRGYWSEESEDLLRYQYADSQRASAVINAFKPPTVLAPIDVWWATDSLDAEGQGQPPVDWGRYTSGGLWSEVVEGDHETIIADPIVHRSVASALRRACSDGGTSGKGTAPRLRHPSGPR